MSCILGRRRSREASERRHHPLASSFRAPVPSELAHDVPNRGPRLNLPSTPTHLTLATFPTAVATAASSIPSTAAATLTDATTTPAALMRPRHLRQHRDQPMRDVL